MLPCMKHVTIPLSEAQHAALERRVADGDYSSVEDYVTALIDTEARARAKERLEALLLEGLASPSISWTQDSMEELRQRARARL